jgi:hypothetical protein
MASSVATAAVVQDDFENPPHTAGNSPAGINGWVTSSTNAGATVTVVNNEQSTFGGVGDSQAVRITDNDPASSGLFSPRLATTAAIPTSNPLQIQFDFKLLTLSENPTFLLMNGGTAGMLLGLCYPGESQMFWTDSSNVRHNLLAMVTGSWYRVEIDLDPLNSVTDGWSLRVQRHDGSSVVQDLTFTNLGFRNELAAATEFRWVFNTGPSSGGDMVLDNVSIVAVPAPAALQAGALLMVIVAATLRRRRAAG